jgi:hypothetical protein
VTAGHQARDGRESETLAGALDVELRGWYLLESLDRMIRDLSPLFELSEPEEITVDLQRLAFIGPTCLAVLVATLKRTQAREYNAPGSVILFPKSGLVSNYLLRMDVFRQVAGDSIPEDFERHEAIGLRPCRHFAEGEAVVAARELSAAIAERVAVDDVAEAALYVALTELAEIVGFHADTPLGGYIAAQGWRKRPEIELAIVDVGVGIRSSLTKNAAYADIADDLTAIMTAVQPLVTSTPDRNSGFGLAFTRGLLQGNGGGVLIRSGTADFYTGADEGASTFDTSFPGTIVALTARTNRPLDQNDGWRAINEAERGV